MIDIQAVKSRITDDDIILLMDSIGVPLVSANSQYLLFPSVCHHPNDWDKANKKLYYYINSQHWHCYSCSGDWDMFGLIQHVKHINFSQAVSYVCSVLHIDAVAYKENNEIDNWQRDLRRWLNYTDDSEQADSTVYNPVVLSAFEHIYPSDWLDYGIGKDSMDKFGIGWYSRIACISIPVFFNNQLVGVRGRYTKPQDLDKGKYRPVAMLDGNILKFSTAQYLYGYDQNKAAIAKSHQVILFESEKSVLKSPSYGIDNSLAVFGSNISKRHIELLLELGVNDVILAFDSDYRQIGDDDFKFFVTKMKKICAKLRPYFSLSIIYNNQGYDAYKCNIMDLPYNKAMTLYESRVNIK